MRRRKLVLALAGAGIGASSSPANAGWLSSLFGFGSSPAAPASAPPAAPVRAASAPPRASTAAASATSAPMPPLGELLFGQSAVLSGPLGEPLLAFNAGAQLVFDDVNAHGGVLGRRIRLISIDDQLQPDKAVAAYQSLLKDHKVFGFFGCTGSATTAAAEPLLRESGAPAFGGYAVSDSARLRNRGAAYFVRATYGREAQTLVQHLTTIGVTRIGVAYLAHPGGEEVLKLISTALAERKLEPAVSAAVALDGTNLAAAARKLIGMEPQAIIMFLGGALAGDLMSQIGQRRQHTSFYGMSIIGGEMAVQRLGERARGLAVVEVMPYPWNQSDPSTKDYRRLAEAAKVPVGYFSFEGYVNAQVLIEALRRSGGLEPNRARLHTVLRSLQMRIAGLDLDFSVDGHTGSRFVELVQVAEGGRFIR
jgi:ABC-type branched-subunit amino acid transport system substrate-binding protein